MVGQSVMYVIVIVFLLGSPPHSWCNVLGEGSPSLNPHQIHWIGHQSCIIQNIIMIINLFIKHTVKLTVSFQVHLTISSLVISIKMINNKYVKMTGYIIE